jgi:hypothetical protein
MVPASLGRWRRTRELNAGSAQCGKMAMDLHGGDRPCARGADPRQYGKKAGVVQRVLPHAKQEYFGSSVELAFWYHSCYGSIILLAFQPVSS